MVVTKCHTHPSPPARLRKECYCPYAELCNLCLCQHCPTLTWCKGLMWKAKSDSNQRKSLKCDKLLKHTVARLRRGCAFFFTHKHLIKHHCEETGFSMVLYSTEESCSLGFLLYIWIFEFYVLVTPLLKYNSIKTYSYTPIIFHIQDN